MNASVVPAHSGPIGRRAIVGALSMLAWTLTAHAAEFGSQAEAKAMARKAAALFRTKGLDDALSIFSLDPGPFRDRDLYVFVWRTDGVVVFHPEQHDWIGRNVLDYTDARGTPLSRNIIAVQDEGWVDYYWPNPKTRAIQAKRGYIVAVGDYRIGVGANKTQ
jgi:cytochrome c